MIAGLIVLFDVFFSNLLSGFSFSLGLGAGVLDVTTGGLASFTSFPFGAT